MNKHKLKQGILLIAAAVILVAVFVVIAVFGSGSDTAFKVGLILTGEADDDGWNGVHYNGVVSACERLDTRLLLKENVAEGSRRCIEAIHELAKEGAQMIILSSYAYPDEVKDIISDYPEIAFYAISSEYSAENLTSYFGRMYQARYLAGVVAGMKTESNAVGYVAAMPNNEVNRGINAFTLGVRSVNPEAKVYVSWTDSWDDGKREAEATEKLIKELNADVMTYHQNQHYTAETADNAGIYSIGYNEIAEGLSDKYLTAAIWNWDSLYYEIIREFVQGQPNSVSLHWFAIDSGVVGLSEMSPSVDADTLKAVENAENRLKGLNDVFSGVIYDNEGGLRCNEGESLSDETLLTGMNWFVDGVVIYNG